MKRALAGILLAALLAWAHAEDAPPAVAGAADAEPPPLAVIPGRQGYAFAQPEILLRQRLFGLAHGLSLLAAACLDLPDHAATTEDAYAAWHARQAKTIETLVRDLARYDFGPRAAQAEWQDLARALNLKDSIQPSLGAVSLPDACASLPEAIAEPRYELDRLLREALVPAAMPAAAAAAPAATVPPAPTLAKPAE